MKRQRGRGRKPGGHHHHQPNRTLESNGPDVKIRGSVSHIYEKYLQLARDAQSSGDRVMAESYLQHAEHYFRILRTMQPTLMPSQMGEGRGQDYDDDVDGEDQAPQEGGDVDISESEQPEIVDGSEGGEAGRDRGGDGDGYGRGRRRNRRPRFRDGERAPRFDGDGGEPREPREPREYREPREPREGREPREAREPREGREPREVREPREGREPREAREPREGRENREPREPREREPREPRERRTPAADPEGFADSPRPAFLSGD